MGNGRHSAAFRARVRLLIRPLLISRSAITAVLTGFFRTSGLFPSPNFADSTKTRGDQYFQSQMLLLPFTASQSLRAILKKLHIEAKTGHDNEIRISLAIIAGLGNMTLLWRPMRAEVRRRIIGLKIGQRGIEVTIHNQVMIYSVRNRLISATAIQSRFNDLKLSQRPQTVASVQF